MINKNLKRVSLKTQEKVEGFYRRLRTDPTGTTVIIELIEGRTIELFFAKGTLEEAIVRQALCRVKRGIKIGIRKMESPLMPISLKKFRNKRTKKLTIYVGVGTGKRLEKFQEPGKSLKTAIVKVLDIVEGRDTIVAVINEHNILCNKMQDSVTGNRVYCSMIGAPVSREYCLEKCVVAAQFKKIFSNIR